MGAKRKTITVAARQDRESVRAALVEGETSGTSPRTPTEIIQAVIAQRRKNGR